ncbi:MAG: N-6 DNA methylase [Oligoflexales bacterium]|nr:N-6 DNA methylase [Oligoflexales bacterium]
MQTSKQPKIVSARYKNSSPRKTDGATYTPTDLSDFVARQILENAHFKKKGALPLRILDPAIGEGRLLLSLLNALRQKGITKVEVFGFEIDREALKKATGRIKGEFPDADIIFYHQDFLQFAQGSGRSPSTSHDSSDSGGCFESLSDPHKQSKTSFSLGLSASHATGQNSDQSKKFDLVIANPPYVRTQILGTRAAQELGSHFQLKGRVDLYHAFLVAIARSLKESGTAGIIVSNRFMTTKSGKTLRSELLRLFSLRHIWDLGDTRLFDAAVLPAVLIACGTKKYTKNLIRFSSIYETKDASGAEKVDTPITALEKNGIVGTTDGRSFLIRHGSLPMTEDLESVWRLHTENSDKWLSIVNSNSKFIFADIGRIRVGVKTCADKVFIRSDWPSSKDDRPELIRPLTTHHIAGKFRASEENTVRQILYPHLIRDGKRTTANLEEFPISKRYLERHRDTLVSRSYVTKAGRKWYEIWVPQDPALWSSPKLVFRDISEEPTFWIDLTGSVVNGDCYWLACSDPQKMDLLWLAATVANSTFAKWYYDTSFNNKLYAGRRRFITQYVEKFPLPDPDGKHSKKMIALAKQLFETRDGSFMSQKYEELDRRVWESFGLTPEDVLSL